MVFVPYERFFYEPDGTISSFAVDPAVPTGETPDELVAHMALMLESLQQPFLLEGDFIPEGDGELEFTFIREDEKKIPLNIGTSLKPVLVIN
jgi:hypothetical protein